MLPEELAMVDSTIEAYKAALLKVGSLKRLTIAQRQQLTQAHNMIFSMLGQLHEPKPLTAYADDKEGHARAWRNVAYALRQVDPLWHTRGNGGVCAAQTAVARLVDPDFSPMIHFVRFPSLRGMVRKHFDHTLYDTEEYTENYFHQLAHRDVYKE